MRAAIAIAIVELAEVLMAKVGLEVEAIAMAIVDANHELGVEPEASTDVQVTSADDPAIPVDRPELPATELSDPTAPVGDSMAPVGDPGCPAMGPNCLPLSRRCRWISWQ